MTRQGREVSPSAGILDSQSIKAPHTRKRGFDAGKKIVGRMRHIAMDTDGRLLMGTRPRGPPCEEGWPVADCRYGYLY